MAKFWGAPVFSIRLSKSLNLNKIPFGNSNYGRSIELSRPHEFSYFFQDLFKLHSINDFVDFSETSKNFDKKIIQINNVKLSKEFGSGLVFKTNFVVNYMNLINKVLEKSLFLYIERDKLDVGFLSYEEQKNIQ